MKRKQIYLVVIGFLLTSLMFLGSNTVVAAESLPFDDIEGHWAKEAIIRWTDHGVFQGFDGKFRPDDNVTVAELATIIVRVLDLPKVPADAEETDGNWFNQAIATLRWHDVSCSTYEANNEMRRQYAVAMLHDALNLNLNNKDDKKRPNELFSDLFPWNTVHEKVRDFHYGGLINGYADGTFKPDNRITRAQVAQILDNIFNLVVDEPGVYSFPEGSRVAITVPGVTIENSSLRFLCVLPSANGEYTLSNCDIITASLFGTDEDNRTLEGMEEHTNMEESNADPGSYYDGGYGFAPYPYLISTVEHLRLIEREAGRHFLLTSDIELSGEWEPIELLAGSLDGGGHSITGIVINHQGGGDVGFFRRTGHSVKNLNLQGSITVTGEVELVDSGYYMSSSSFVPVTDPSLNVGLLAGKVGSSVDNCNIDVTINVDITGKDDLTNPVTAVISVGGLAGITGHGAYAVNRVTVEGTVTSKISSEMVSNHNVGGICGTLQFGLTDAISKTTVQGESGEYVNCGAFVGAASSGDVKSGYANANVHAMNAIAGNRAGGIVGMSSQSSKVEKVSFEGTVSADGTPFYFHSVGGIVGSAFSDTIVENCYSLGTLETNDYIAAVGGIVGRLTNSKVFRCYSLMDADGFAYAAQTLVGAIGSDTYKVENCGMFICSEPHILVGDTEVLPVTQQDMETQSTYESMGWDFETVWQMPDASSDYRLPVLRASVKEEQD